VLFVPPFGEELNKARRMVHLQAHDLAAHGIGLSLLDLYGTGDSEGEFRDATWEQWLDDLDAAVAALQASGAHDIVYLGLRSGALLAAEHAATRGATALLILWQPWLDGRTELNTLLKMRVAADKFSGEGADASVAGLRQEIESGEPVEIGGYEIGKRLFAAVDGKQLLPLVQGVSTPIHWLDLGAGPQPELLPARAKVVEALRASPGCSARVVEGAKFWGTVEIETSPALIAATTEILAAP